MKIIHLKSLPYISGTNELNDKMQHHGYVNESV